jgi:hypothetical protein
MPDEEHAFIETPNCIFVAATGVKDSLNAVEVLQGCFGNCRAIRMDAVIFLEAERVRHYSVLFDAFSFLSASGGCGPDRTM